MKTTMKQLTSREEYEQVITEDKITVFLFSADWCPDCRFLEPFLDDVLKMYESYQFLYVDRDQWSELCQELMVMGIPSFVAMRNGQEIGRFVSKLRKSRAEIEAFLGGLK